MLCRPGRIVVNIFVLKVQPKYTPSPYIPFAAQSMTQFRCDVTTDKSLFR